MYLLGISLNVMLFKYAVSMMPPSSSENSWENRQKLHSIWTSHHFCLSQVPDFLLKSNRMKLKECGFPHQNLYEYVFSYHNKLSKF